MGRLARVPRRAARVRGRRAVAVLVLSGARRRAALAAVQAGPVPDLLAGASRPGDAQTAAATRTITRCYSLSDRPDPAHYRVTIKRVPPPADRPELPPGLSSSHFHDQVHEGDVLRVKAPSGHFLIDPDPGVPAVLIGGGIGITPMMSMLRWCLAAAAAAHGASLLRGAQQRASMPSSSCSRRSRPRTRPAPERRLQPARPRPTSRAATTSTQGTSTSNCCAAHCRTGATSSTSAGRRR